MNCTHNAKQLPWKLTVKQITDLGCVGKEPKAECKPRRPRRRLGSKTPGCLAQGGAARSPGLPSRAPPAWPPAPARSGSERLPEGGSGSSVLNDAPLPAFTDSIRTSSSRTILPAAACRPIPERGAPPTGYPRRPWPGLASRPPQAQQPSPGDLGGAKAEAQRPARSVGAWLRGGGTLPGKG